MSENKNFVAIATKISLESYVQLNKIAQKANIKIYQMLQVVVDSYLRVLSEEEPITDHIEKVVRTFANFDILKNSFCFCCPPSNKNKMVADSCLYFLRNPNKSLIQPILIRKDKDQYYQTINRNEILRFFISSFSPSCIEELKEIQDENNLLSFSDSLQFAVSYCCRQGLKNISSEIEQLFLDNNRDEFGAEIDYSEIGQYKRVYCRTGCFDREETISETESENI